MDNLVTVDGRECPSDDELAAFLDGTVDDRERARLEAHFDRCENCRAAVGHVAHMTTGPRTIDRYKLEAQLGAGGMGVVWRAWDPALERPLAIKLLHPELHDTEGRERAIREARALARLQHPNVVAIYDVGEYEGDVFIATELVDGQSMDKWQRGKSPREIVAAYAQAARGLAAAHAIGLVHRDVKPSNILVSRDGRVRVGDFGLATNAAHSSVARAPAAGSGPSTPLPVITEHGQVLGTPAYMAPEQHESAAVDARADQYSLCLALAETLLGTRPDFDPTAASLAKSDVPAPWAAIARGLRANPSERFPHIEDLVAALEPTPRRRLVPWLLAGVALVGIVSVALWGALRSPEQRPSPPVVAPVTAPAPAPRWMWKTQTTGPWLLPFNVRDLIVFDAKRAAVFDMNTLGVIDLATGAVTVSKPFGEDGRPETFVRVGNRVLVFGLVVGEPAAWQLTLDPPLATPVALPPPPKADDSYTTRYGLASPDGRTIFTCAYGSHPVLRDATTLAIVRAYPGVPCSFPSFLDNSHILYRADASDQLLDLTTGKSTQYDRTKPYAVHGPGGFRFEVRDDVARLFENKRRIRTDAAADFLENVQWNARYAVVEQSSKLAIYPLDPDGNAHTVALPELGTMASLGDTFAIVVSGRSVLRIDLASGRMQKPSANLATVTAVAPRGGSVLASSDKLRVWRDGKLVGTTESAVHISVGDATAPVALLDFTKLDLWTPETNDRERVQELGFALSIGRDGDTLVVAETDRLLRGTTSATLQTWHTLRDDVRLEGMSVRQERIALESEKATHIVDLKARTSWSLMAELYDECVSLSDVMFSPDGALVLAMRRGLVLVDTVTRTATSIDLDDYFLSATFLGTGEVIVVGNKRIVLFDPKTRRALAWATEYDQQPAQIAVSPDDAELAIAYDDGSVWWIDIAGLRKRLTPFDVKVEPVRVCDVKQRDYGSLVVE